MVKNFIYELNFCFRHSDKREFLCNECGKTFKRKDKLKEHAKRIHSQERKAKNAAQAQAHAAQQAMAAQQGPSQPQAPLVINEEASGSNNNDKFVPRVSLT